jgi:outer membrane protein assembly factor BamB
VGFGSDDGSVYALDAANGTPRWRFATEGPVRASVAIVDGVVYAVSHDRHVYALDAATGALRWKHRGKSPGGTAPAVVHGLAFAGFGYGWSGELVGLRVADGSEAWRYRFEGPNALGDGVTVDGERLYTPVDDIQSSAIDLATEYRLWKHSGTPTRATMPVDGERVYYAAEGRVYALDKRTGERRWAWYPKAPAIRATGERETVCSPALAEGLVVQGWDNGEVVAIAAVDGALRWSAGTGAPVMASPAVAGGIVHTANDDGVVLALRLSDGAELWRLPLPAAVRAAPWPRDGVLYVGCDDGTVRALESTEPRP